MPVPKKRRSKSQKRMKRACWKITMPNLSHCKNCNSLVPSHRACTNCGFYKGSVVLETKLESTKG